MFNKKNDRINESKITKAGKKQIQSLSKIVQFQMVLLNYNFMKNMWKEYKYIY